MSVALNRLEAIQRSALDRLASTRSSVERDLLTQLIETSCLLELAKVDAALFEPVTYLRQTLDIVGAMYPTRRARIDLTGSRLAAVRLESGTSYVADLPCWDSTLHAAGEPVGLLALHDPIVEIDVQGFADSAATQMSSGLDACVEAEDQRRGAAVATAMRLANEIDPTDPIATLEAVAEQFAAFPGSIAAEFVVDHPVIGAPLTARSGLVPDPADAEDPQSRNRARVTTREGDAGLLIVKRHGPGVGNDPDTEQFVVAVLEQIDLSLDRMQRQQDLEREVETDPLTGLGNRRRMDRVLSAALTRAEHCGERVALLMLDLDGFKVINDTLGHDVGDLVLRACARSLQHVTRGYDEIVRLGGDEIVVVSPGSDVVAAYMLAEEIRHELPVAARTVLAPGSDLSVSIGVATFPDAARSASDLLKAADDAMYTAKRQGKNSVVVAPSDAADPEPIEVPVPTIGFVGEETSGADGVNRADGGRRRWGRLGRRSER